MVGPTDAAVDQLAIQADSAIRQSGLRLQVLRYQKGTSVAAPNVARLSLHQKVRPRFSPYPPFCTGVNV